jgi:4'-phosphopantetheinyl transferase
MKTTIFLAEISDIADSRMDYFMSLVTKEKQKKLEKYRHIIDRKLSLYAEVLVRKQITNHLGIQNSEISFEKGKYGKPYLKNHPKFYFNISHTRRAIAVAFSKSEIGIDIERIRPCDLKIAKRFFTQEENSYINNCLDFDKAFYEIWTKKEAYLKHTGKGLNCSLKSFDVTDIKTEQIFNTFEIENGKYIFSVCRNNGADIPISLIYLEKDIVNLH